MGCSDGFGPPQRSSLMSISCCALVLCDVSLPDGLQLTSPVLTEGRSKADALSPFQRDFLPFLALFQGLGAFTRMAFVIEICSFLLWLHLTCFCGIQDSISSLTLSYLNGRTCNTVNFYYQIIFFISNKIGVYLKSLLWLPLMLS